MSEPTEEDYKRLTDRITEVLAQNDSPDEGKISWEWRGGEWRQWFVEMRLGDEWTGKDIDLVVYKTFGES